MHAYIHIRIYLNLYIYVHLFVYCKRTIRFIAPIDGCTSRRLAPRACSHTLAHLNMHAHAHAFEHAFPSAHVHIHAHTHARTRAHTRAHTRTHIRTCFAASLTCHAYSQGAHTLMPYIHPKIPHILLKEPHILDKSQTTRWPRLIGCLKQVIFRRRATNYRAQLRKMTYKDMAFNGSSQPCTNKTPLNTPHERWGAGVETHFQEIS